MPGLIFPILTKDIGYINHLKGINHKRLDVDSIFDFITTTTASNITKQALADIIADLIKQNIIIGRKSIIGRDSFKRNTIDVLRTTDEISDTNNNQEQNEIHRNDNNKSHTLIPDIDTLCSSQQLAPEITTETTSLNTTTETFPTVPTNIHITIATNSQNDTSNFSILNIEAQLSILKSY